MGKLKIKECLRAHQQGYSNSLRIDSQIKKTETEIEKIKARLVQYVQPK